MSEVIQDPITDTPAERLWRAIIAVDLLAHDKLPSRHQPDEVIQIKYNNQRGEEAAMNLEYCATTKALPYVPRITSRIGPIIRPLNQETITFISDTSADIKESRTLPQTWMLLTMAARAEQMRSLLQASDEKITYSVTFPES